MRARAASMRPSQWKRQSFKSQTTSHSIRDGHIHKAGDSFEADKDDEIKRWLELAYLREIKARRSAKKTARRK
jgi:hypothetical protein